MATKKKLTKLRSRSISKRARRKELTGINLEAIHKRLEEIEAWQALVMGFVLHYPVAIVDAATIILNNIERIEALEAENEKTRNPTY